MADGKIKKISYQEKIHNRMRTIREKIRTYPTLARMRQTDVRDVLVDVLTNQAFLLAAAASDDEKSMLALLDLVIDTDGHPWMSMGIGIRFES